MGNKEPTSPPVGWAQTREYLEQVRRSRSQRPRKTPFTPGVLVMLVVVGTYGLVTGIYSLITHPGGHDHAIRDVLSVIFIVLGALLLAEACKRIAERRRRKSDRSDLGQTAERVLPGGHEQER